MIHFVWPLQTRPPFDYGLYEIANAEIVKYAARELGRHGGFALHGFRDGRLVQGADDVLIGHPTFDHPSFGPPADESADWMALNDHPNSYVLMPWTSLWGETQTKPFPFMRRQLEQARAVIGLCGRYWHERTMALDDGSMGALIKHKFVQVNMGCAAHNLPRKTQYRRGGARRNFLHVSNLDYYKRIDVLFDSFWSTEAQLIVASANLGQGTCRMELTNGHVLEFMSLGPFSNASAEFNQFVLEHCDFYVHTSDHDAQATAILENAARGLVPLVTPESGFECEYALTLSLDPAANRTVIAQAMDMSDEEYRIRSLGVRRHVEQHHAWEAIYGQVWDTIERTRI